MKENTFFKICIIFLKQYFKKFKLLNDEKNKLVRHNSYTKDIQLHVFN